MFVEELQIGIALQGMWGSSLRLKSRYFISGREAWESRAGQGIIAWESMGQKAKGESSG